MTGSPLVVVRSAFMTLQGIVGAFRQQGLGWVAWLAVLVFILALFFAFLAFAPILSPFVYPLF